MLIDAHVWALMNDAVGGEILRQQNGTASPTHRQNEIQPTKRQSRKVGFSIISASYIHHLVAHPPNSLALPPIVSYKINLNVFLYGDCNKGLAPPRRAQTQPNKEQLQYT